ncbi:MAG: hypothetical protein Q4G29_01695 [Pseudoscardovia radai]|nr:hypothetical protein [Pseudoscardovia radai]
MGGVAACGTTHTIDDPPASSESSSTGFISRATLYGSIADLAAASDVVVEGR